MSTSSDTRWPTRRIVLLALLAGSIPAIDAAEPAAGPVSQGPYQYREVHDPDGIGKFHLGREIAQVMGHQGADWLERPGREDEEHTEALVEALALKAGMVVADIGAGSGYVARRMARRVAPHGRVLAVDIQPEMLSLLTNKAARAGLTNIIPVLGTATDPKLPARSVDLALLVDVYHEFEFPVEMVSAICAALNPGGRLVLVEYRGEDPAVPIKPLHKMTEAQVRKEMSPYPLTFLKNPPILPRQHILVFRKDADDDQPRQE